MNILSDRTMDIALWIEEHTAEYNELPPYLRQAFVDAVNAIYEHIVPDECPSE